MTRPDIKGYKVTNVRRSRFCGIACSSLRDLLTKACHKFEFPEKKVKLFLQDGTIVDNEEYFATLPAQTVLVLAKGNEPVLTGADLIYNALRATNADLLKAGEQAQMFLTEDLKEKIKVIARALQEDKELTLKSSREEHPDWFKGLETSCRDKESYMGRRCADRMRGYLSKTRRDTLNSAIYRHNPKARLLLDEVLQAVGAKLRSAGYQAAYFDRRQKEDRLCDPDGRFDCQGVWSDIRCHHTDHTINPYASRENRIIFSTWNLDHRIERSRTILPTLLRSAELVSKEEETGARLESDHLFRLLLSRENLRLVHIVCHDKATHTAASLDPTLFTTTPSEVQHAILTT